MGKSMTKLLRITILALGLFTVYSVLAIDLLPVDVNPIRVGACDHQVRFKVKLVATANEYGTKNVSANYRIGVYSVVNKTLLTSFSISAQKVGDEFVFVVPSKILACEHGAEIVVDDRKQVRESIESNNKITVHWKHPGKIFGSTCVAVLEKCLE